MARGVLRQDPVARVGCMQEGRTALHYAAVCGAPLLAILDALLAAGSDVNAFDKARALGWLHSRCSVDSSAFA